MAELLYPKWIANVSDSMLNEIGGGCGPGKMGDYFVPDKLLGVSIWKACWLHDIMYFYVANRYDKMKADVYLLYNMVVLVLEKSSNFITRSIRLWLAWKYFRAVLEFGKPSFLG